ncbi:MAG: spoIVFB [Lacunisphaera sp.]|nr:spoIVFB [Lacunisphaera sp.]
MLGWSINLFRVFGIQLAVHASFFLLLAYYGYDGWRDGGLPGLVWSVSLIVLFFICVILHELGHSLTARRYGVRVPRILLLPIGGMAEFDHIPKEPKQELLITLAGPAVNFILAALLLPLVWHGLTGDEEVPAFSLTTLVDQLWVANLIMGTFNLLPVFPMDGGRILRACLAFNLPYLRATWWAALVSKILAPIFALIAFFVLHWPMMGVLFLFILFVGDKEYKLTLRREEEERHWEEIARRLAAAQAAGEAERLPPVIVHGPN